MRDCLHKWFGKGEHSWGDWHAFRDGLRVRLAEDEFELRGVERYCRVCGERESSAGYCHVCTPRNCTRVEMPKVK